MSGSDPTPTPEKTRSMCTIIARSSFPGTEIEVVAADKRIVGHGVQRVEAKVTAGIYVVRATLDTRSNDEIVVVEPGQPTSVTIEAPQISSPIPLDHTRTSHEYHQDFATDVSSDEKKMLVLGQGAELMVIAREWNAEPRRPRTPHTKPGSNLLLYSGAGELLLDYSVGGLSANGPDPAMGLTAKVDPGAYRLRTADPVEPSRYSEVALYVPHGWQLQVFLLARDEHGAILDDDLTRAAITMRRMGRAFSPADYDGHLVEAARRTLESRTGGLAAEGVMLDQLLYDRFENPMLGLAAAHAMHMRKQLDPKDLPQVASNLEKLLGPIPDVTALKLEADPDADVPRIELPPMLRASWSILLDHSVRRPELIANVSFAASISACVIGSGAWLVWEGTQPLGFESKGRIWRSTTMYVLPPLREIASEEDRLLAVRFFGVPSSLVHVVSPAVRVVDE